MLEVLLSLFMAGLLLYVMGVTLPAILRAEEIALNSSRLTLLGQRLFTDCRLAAVMGEDRFGEHEDEAPALRHEVAEVTEGETAWRVHSAWSEARPSHMMRMAFSVAGPK